jgi:hypothetical protein
MTKPRKTNTEPSQSARKRRTHVPQVIDGKTGKVVQKKGRITRLKKAKAVRGELARLYRAAKANEMSVGTARQLASILEKLLAAIEVADFEQRLDVLTRDVRALHR